MSNRIVYEVESPDAAPEARKIHGKMLSLVEALRPASVLEIGSGTGILGADIVARGIRYKGIEPVEAQFALCKRQFPNLDVIRASCYDAPATLGLGTYDLVISNDVIEHLYLPRALVGFAKAHLRRGGTAITCTPDFGSYWKNIAYSLAGKWDSVHSPLWDGGHIKFFSRRSLQAIFEEAGFSRFRWDFVRNVNLPIFKMSVICICSMEDCHGAPA